MGIVASSTKGAGFVVDFIDHAGPAALSGLVAIGDILISVDGQAILRPRIVLRPLQRARFSGRGLVQQGLRGRRRPKRRSWAQKRPWRS